VSLKANKKGDIIAASNRNMNNSKSNNTNGIYSTILSKYCKQERTVSCHNNKTFEEGNNNNDDENNGITSISSLHDEQAPVILSLVFHPKQKEEDSTTTTGCKEDSKIDSTAITCTSIIEFLKDCNCLAPLQDLLGTKNSYSRLNFNSSTLTTRLLSDQTLLKSATITFIKVFNMNKNGNDSNNNSSSFTLSPKSFDLQLLDSIAISELKPSQSPSQSSPSTKYSYHDNYKSLIFSTSDLEASLSVSSNSQQQQPSNSLYLHTMANSILGMTEWVQYYATGIKFQNTSINSGSGKEPVVVKLNECEISGYYEPIYHFKDNENNNSGRLVFEHEYDKSTINNKPSPICCGIPFTLEVRLVNYSRTTSTSYYCKITSNCLINAYYITQDNHVTRKENQQQVKQVKSKTQLTSSISTKYLTQLAILVVFNPLSDWKLTSNDLQGVQSSKETNRNEFNEQNKSSSNNKVLVCSLESKDTGTSAMNSSYSMMSGGSNIQVYAYDLVKELHVPSTYSSSTITNNSNGSNNSSKHNEDDNENGSCLPLTRPGIIYFNSGTIEHTNQPGSFNWIPIPTSLRNKSNINTNGKWYKYIYSNRIETAQFNKSYPYYEDYYSGTCYGITFKHLHINSIVKILRDIMIVPLLPSVPLDNDSNSSSSFEHRFNTMVVERLVPNSIYSASSSLCDCSGSTVMQSNYTLSFSPYYTNNLDWYTSISTQIFTINNLCGIHMQNSNNSNDGKVLDLFPCTSGINTELFYYNTNSYDSKATIQVNSHGSQASGSIVKFQVQDDVTGLHYEISTGISNSTHALFHYNSTTQQQIIDNYKKFTNSTASTGNGFVLNTSIDSEFTVAKLLLNLPNYKRKWILNYEKTCTLSSTSKTSRYSLGLFLKACGIHPLAKYKDYSLYLDKDSYFNMDTMVLVAIGTIVQRERVNNEGNEGNDGDDDGGLMGNMFGGADDADSSATTVEDDETTPIPAKIVIGYAKGIAYIEVNKTKKKKLMFIGQEMKQQLLAMTAIKTSKFSNVTVITTG